MIQSDFILQGKRYEYLDHTYNCTRQNERTVEVPPGLFLCQVKRNVLEIGCVLPHYLPDWPTHGHEVIDLHEDFPGVINADVLTYEPSRQYDLIISISTLEHLGTVCRFQQALDRMQSWLFLNGLLFVTIPHGAAQYRQDCTPGLDPYVRMGHTGCQVLRLDKIDPANHLWRETPLYEPPLA